MKKLKKRTILSMAAVVAMLLAVLAGCKAPDPLLDFGPLKFAALYDGEHSQARNGFFILESPSERDYVAISNDLRKPDPILVGIDLSDFMQAGLDPQSMKNDDFKPGLMVYDLPTSSLVISCQFPSAAPASATVSATPAALFSALLQNQAQSLRFDQLSQRYILSFQPGLLMDWLESGDGKFTLGIVIDAQPFINAGLKIDRLKNWKSEKITTAAGSITTRLRLSFTLP